MFIEHQLCSKRSGLSSGQEGDDPLPLEWSD